MHLSSAPALIVSGLLLAGCAASGTTRHLDLEAAAVPVASPQPSAATSTAATPSEATPSEATPLEAAAVPAGPAEPAAATATPALAYAAPQDGTYGPKPETWELQLGGSGATDNDFDVGGGNLSGSVGYFFNERSELGVRQTVSFSDFGDSIWNGTTRFFYDYHFGDGEVRPLIGANLGWVYGDSIDESLAAAPEAGVKWYLRPDTFLFILAEYQFFFEDADDADDTFSDGSFIYTLGLGLNL